MASEPMDLDPKPPLLPPPPSSRTGKVAPGTSQLCDTIPKFRPAKVFRRDDIKDVQSLPYVLSIDYDDMGELLMTSESDETIQIYSVIEGRHVKGLVTRKYGAKLARFTHTSHGIIYASTKVNDAIRYLSAHDNSFVRYFDGHEASVTCLAMHPGSDQFISCSVDNTVLLWDARVRPWQGKLLLHHPYLTAFDPSATAFAVASPSSGSVLLYDFRYYEKGPFLTVDLVKSCRHVDPLFVGKGWTRLEFANDGKQLMVGTRGKGHFVMDAFDGSLRAYLRKPEGGTGRLAAGESAPAGAGAVDGGGGGGGSASLGSSGDCCFSPDGRFVLGGSKSNVLVWDLEMPAEGGRKILEPKYVLEDKREAAVLAMNPRFNFFATADRDLIFWVPEIRTE